MLNYLTGTDESLGKKKKPKKKKKGLLKKVAKIGLAPARASFLLLISVNALKLGTKLSKVWNKDSQRLISFWTKLGGKTEALKKAIAKGSKQTLSGAELGDPFAVAMATALPIVVAIAKILKDMGITTPKEQGEERESIEQGKKDLDSDASVTKGEADLPEGAESGKEKTTAGSFNFIYELTYGNPVNALLKSIIVTTAIGLQFPQIEKFISSLIKILF